MVKLAERRCNSAKVRRKYIRAKGWRSCEMLLFFQWFVCRFTLKVGLSKRQNAERRHQKLHVALAKRRFGSENFKKNWRSWSTFWSSDEKMHAAVAKRTFGSENVKKWRCRSTFWSSDVEKMHAWRNAHVVGTFFEVQMSNKMHTAAKRKFGSENVQDVVFGALFKTSDVEHHHVDCVQYPYQCQSFNHSDSQLVSHPNIQLVS